MWPWRPRPKPVTLAEAGDDTTAALAMILHHYRKRATLDEIRRAIHADGDPRPSAQAIAVAAERFGLRMRGIQLDDATQVLHLTLPCIAHVMTTPWATPRMSLPPEGAQGLFVVVVNRFGNRMTMIDPESGDRTEIMAKDLIANGSGVFLLFERAQTLPVARLISSRSP